jgi:hypothetical protein
MYETTARRTVDRHERMHEPAGENELLFLRRTLVQNAPMIYRDSGKLTGGLRAESGLRRRTRNSGRKTGIGAASVMISTSAH